MYLHRLEGNKVSKRSGGRFQPYSPDQCPRTGCMLLRTESWIIRDILHATVN